MKGDHYIIILSIFTGLFVWVIDALLNTIFLLEGLFLDIDDLLFYGRLFLYNLIFDVPRHNLYLRSIVMAIFIIFGILVSRTLINHRWSGEAFRRFEERGKAIAERSFSIMHIGGDARGGISHVSPSVEWILGYKSEEVVGKPFKELLPESEISRGVQVFTEALEGKKVKGVTTKMLRKDGSIASVEINSLPIILEGKVVGFQGVVRDIAERKQMEEEIKSLSKFPSEDPNPVLRLNRKGTVLYANKAGLMLLQELGCEVGKRAPKFWQKMVSEVLTNQSSKIIEVEQGEQVYSFFVSPIMDAGYVNLYGRDITERKKMEDKLKRYTEHLEELVDERTSELKQSEERYALAQSAANIGSWEWDIKTNAIYWSDHIEPMFGFGQGEFEGTYEAFLNSVHSDDRQYLIDSFNASVEKGKNYDIEHRIVWPDGTVRWVLEIGNVFRDENGKAIRMLGIVQDITERKKLDQMKERFISTATHELRTPLISIKGYVDYILAGKMGSLTDKILSSLEVVKRNTNRLISLTDDLLDIRRIESGKIHINMEPLDFCDIISHCSKESLPFFDEKKQQFDLIVPEGPLMIKGDHIRLCQVVMNLLANANKFTPERGMISLRVEEEKDVIQVQVSDTGIGIRKDDLKKIFLPFADIKKSNYIKGTGLGLSVTRGLVEAHGGRIWAESTGEGKGAVFTFSLPRLFISLNKNIIKKIKYRIY